MAPGEKLRWRQVMADYLASRTPLAGVVLLVDSRLGLTELDERLLRFIEPRVAAGEVRLLVLLTKADKLNHREAQASLARVQERLGAFATEESDIAVSLFSAQQADPVADAAVALHGWVHEPKPGT